MLRRALRARDERITELESEVAWHERRAAGVGARSPPGGRGGGGAGGASISRSPRAASASASAAAGAAGRPPRAATTIAKTSGAKPAPHPTARELYARALRDGEDRLRTSDERGGVPAAAPPSAPTSPPTVAAPAATEENQTVRETRDPWGGAPAAGVGAGIIRSLMQGSSLTAAGSRAGADADVDDAWRTSAADVGADASVRADTAQASTRHGSPSDGKDHPSSAPSAGTGRRVVAHLPGGGRRVEFPNGTVKEQRACGSLAVWFPNGDVRVTRPGACPQPATCGCAWPLVAAVGQGSACAAREDYFYAEVGTWHTSFEDGAEIFRFPGGQAEAHLPSGRKEVLFPDGAVRLMEADGSERDGTRADLRAELVGAAPVAAL